MTTKLRLLCVLAWAFGINASFANNPCDNFYSKVTYALNHTKKGMSATNFEHQMYYAERAMEALEKGKTFMQECSCDKADERTLDAMETLDKAIEPIDWEAGRFFTKKAMGQINELITILDNCTLGVTFAQSVEDSDVAKLEHQAHASQAEQSETTDRSIEQEKLNIFQAHANEKLADAEKAINALLEFSNTISVNPENGSDDPNSLHAHQKAYLDKVKNLLDESAKKLGYEE